ncbi:hypothetical protein BDR26DRAFT_866527 [Obelidium mucronatum]|nr:hypothetical protein BDR26DRAFT_866527 [Obelidium mucronatum]
MSDCCGFRYIPELKGVPLSYSNVKIEEKVANVLYDSPFCHLHATCTFTLFAPREGSTIVAIVNKVSSDHIGLLVHGVFNASIAAEHIQKTEYHFNHGAKAWRRVDEDGEPTGEKIAAGSVVKFTIIGLPTNNNLLTLSGSLTKDPENTGLIILDPETTPPHPAPVLLTQDPSAASKLQEATPGNSKIYFDMEAEVNDAHEEDADEWVVGGGGGDADEGEENSPVKAEPDTVPVKQEKSEKKEKKKKAKAVKVEEPPVVQVKEEPKPKKRKNEGEDVVVVKKEKKEKKVKV